MPDAQRSENRVIEVWQFRAGGTQWKDWLAAFGPMSQQRALRLRDEGIDIQLVRRHVSTTDEFVWSSATSCTTSDTEVQDG